MADSVSFVMRDDATQGTWSGVYGALGYSWIGDAAPTFLESLPSGVTRTDFNASYFVYADPDDSNVKSPQKPPSFAHRWASIRYGGFPSVRWQLPGPMRIGVYLLDYDSGGRVETVDWKTFGGTTLYSDTVSGFSGGSWLIFDCDGDVTFRAVQVSGANAVMSGFTFDSIPPPPGPPAGGLGGGFPLRRGIVSRPRPFAPGRAR